MATDSIAIERGRALHEAVERILTDHKVDAKRFGFVQCGCEICKMLRPYATAPVKDQIDAINDRLGAADIVVAPVIAGLEEWNRIHLEPVAIGSEHDAVMTYGEAETPHKFTVQVTDGQLPDGVDLRSDGLITNAVDILKKLRTAQRELEHHEAELRRLATYKHFSAGMKDSRRRHSEQAQIQRDTIRNMLR